MVIKNIPDDLNAEILVASYPDETFDVEFKSIHNRNAYKDIVSVDVRKKRLQLLLGRNSLYNKLPEYLFHQIDRYNRNDKKEDFAKELSKQEEEEENAYRFFFPLDAMLFKIRSDIKKNIEDYTSGNKVLQDIIGDTLTEKQRNNRFIKRTLQYLPACKNIRGDRTLITMMIRKVFHDENIIVDVSYKDTYLREDVPRYCDHIDSLIEDTFVGYGFTENVLTYKIHFWSDDDCDENFSSFIDETEEYRRFIQDYFVSVESLLEFEIQKDEAPLKLSDKNRFNYLGYNTNI